MTSLAFLFFVVAVFAAVLALESGKSLASSPRRPLGLIAWLTGGNWPAKIGGALLIVGFGALLRYALINLQIDPGLKLGFGVLASAVLGLAAYLTRTQTSQRAVSLALGGAAFGVAYLTAYSAFALFGYLRAETGLSLLVLTALGSAVYAVTRDAVSLAILAMLGAFLAPAFASTDPGPVVVFGYYAAASLMTLGMIAVRGWRPLIHLSFLFTLLGGAFFTWTAEYYAPKNAAVMLPALLVLTALHVAMPLVERGGLRADWSQRLDTLYHLALPSVAALTALGLAPSRTALSNELFALAAIWAAAAGYLWLARREGRALHAVIAVLLAGIATAARYRELPWELIALAFVVAALWLAARRAESERLVSILAGMVPIVGIAHVLSNLAPAVGEPLFFNGRFIERALGAALFLLAANICRRARQSLDTLLWSIGVGWAIIAIGSELLRADFINLSLLLHALFVTAAGAVALTQVPARLRELALAVLPTAILVTAAWAARSAQSGIAVAAMLVAPLAMLALALTLGAAERAERMPRILAATFAPLVAGLWAARVAEFAAFDSVYFVLTISAAWGLLFLVAGALAPNRSREWLTVMAELFGFAYAFALAMSTTLVISRSPWAVMLEIVSLLGLLSLHWAIRAHGAPRAWLTPLLAIAAALWIQAVFLRLFGPPGELTLFDLTRTRWPALLSLLWASFGAALTIWGRRASSRGLWVAGAALLIAATVKIVLLDFGTLGQLTNILAVIAAGLVFLLVGWLAPMPPATHEEAPAPHESTVVRVSEPPSAPQAEPGHDKSRAWVIAIVVTLIASLSQCRYSPLHKFERSRTTAPIQDTTFTQQLRH